MQNFVGQVDKFYQGYLGETYIPRPTDRYTLPDNVTNPEVPKPPSGGALDIPKREEIITPPKVDVPITPGPGTGGSDGSDSSPQPDLDIVYSSAEYANMQIKDLVHKNLSIGCKGMHIFPPKKGYLEKLGIVAPQVLFEGEYAESYGYDHDPSSITSDRMYHVVKQMIITSGAFRETTAKDFRPLYSQGKYYVKNKVNVDIDLIEEHKRFIEREMRIISHYMDKNGLTPLNVDIYFDIMRRSEIIMDPYVLRVVLIQLLRKAFPHFWCYVVSRDLEEEFIDAIKIIPVVLGQ